MATKKTFAQILKEKRLEKGWSIINLADKLGTNPQTVRNWESYGNEPCLFFLVCLADVFECSMDELAGRV